MRDTRWSEAPPRAAASGPPLRPDRFPLHEHEADRMASLRSYGLLDTPREPAYDGIVDVLATALDVQMAMISLVDADRQWFKAYRGVEFRQTPRDQAFCAYVVASGEPLVVPDALADPRFASFGLVRDGVRSYAGVPLVGRDGLPLGALCVLDVRPHAFDDHALDVLLSLAPSVVAQMELDRIDQRAGDGRRRPDADRSGIALRRALDEAEIRPYFQVVVDVETRAPCGMEALARWVAVDRVVPPDEFIPALEASELIVPVGRHIARQALGALAALRRDDVVSDRFGVSINVSPVQLAQIGFADSFLADVEAAGVPFENVTVEVTESRAITPVAEVARELDQLRDAGVRVDADDFGSGYGTLQRLLDLPLTGLKLDLGIVRRIPGDLRTKRVVGSIIAIAHDIGLGVVGEGVETQAQFDCLRELGCDRVQGHLFGRAVALEGFAA